MPALLLLLPLPLTAVGLPSVDADTCFFLRLNDNALDHIKAKALMVIVRFKMKKAGFEPES